MLIELERPKLQWKLEIYGCYFMESTGFGAPVRWVPAPGMVNFYVRVHFPSVCAAAQPSWSPISWSVVPGKEWNFGPEWSQPEPIPAELLCNCVSPTQGDWTRVGGKCLWGREKRSKTIKKNPWKLLVVSGCKQQLTSVARNLCIVLIALTINRFKFVQNELLIWSVPI